MIDLHCHLACGVDDGPQTPEESLALATGLKNAGVTHVACTSHLRRDKAWINDQAAQENIHQNLDQILGDIGPIRFKGAEHYLDELLLETCQQKKAVPYSNLGWILLELPYQIEPLNLMNTLFKIRMSGYKILLAHLERYPYITSSKQKIEALLNAGYLIQVNLGSLSGAYGEEYRKRAEKLLQADYVSLVASDCHHERDIQPYLLDGLKALKRLASKSQVQELTIDQPAKLLGL